MTDPRDYKLDISGHTPNAQDPARSPRRFLSVRFDCCTTYARVYEAHDGKSYSGACPRCGKRISFPIGPGGTDSRFFVVK